MSYQEDPEAMSLEERMEREGYSETLKALRRAHREIEQLRADDALLRANIQALREDRDEWRRRSEGAGELIALREQEIADLDRLAMTQALGISILESKIKRLESAREDPGQ